jgi:peroxiredoxin
MIFGYPSRPIGPTGKRTVHIITDGKVRKVEMLWIRFDEQDRRTSAPSFCLSSYLEERVCLHDLYEKNNLVIVFMHDLDCQDCDPTINAFAERELEYRGQESQVLIIIPNGIQERGTSTRIEGFLAAPSEEMGARLLFDPGGVTRRAYAELMSSELVDEDDNILFVLDAYGAPYTAVIAKHFNNGDIHNEVLSWLQYINIQCPE